MTYLNTPPPPVCCHCHDSGPDLLQVRLAVQGVPEMAQITHWVCSDCRPTLRELFWEFQRPLPLPKPNTSAAG